jgi:hypothetical protein
MVTLYVASSEPHAGKTLACVVLGMRWRAQQRAVGYLKPLAPFAGQPADEDATFVAAQLGLPATPSQLCPALLTPDLCAEGPVSVRRRITEAFAAASAGKEVMLVSGSGSVLTRGAMIGLTGLKVAELLDARVLLMAKCAVFADADTILAAVGALRTRLVGAILTRLPPKDIQEVRRTVVPCLEHAGATVLGLLPEDPALNSVSVREIAEETEAQFLTCAEAGDELVEHLVVGAMSVESALRYFRQTPRKCVVTGGDRGDVQLAALDTPTKCLVLTGDLRPNHIVLERATELCVPVLLVKGDTLSTIAVIEGLLGNPSLRAPAKARYALKQFEAHVDLAALDTALGLT